MTPLLSSTLLRTQSDARLVMLAQRGYERAFEAIVERYRRPLFRWCRRVLPEARAEDAVQVAFLKAWSAIQAGDEVRDLRPWLYRIAHNAALDNARKAGYDYDELTDALRLAPAPDEDLERRSVMRETLTGVAGLPDNQRQALLRTAAGHSRADIARELDLSEGAVRQLVHRARTRLRAAATGLMPTPVATWLATLGAETGAPAGQRIAELAAGAASAGTAASAVKASTVVVAAGVLAAGPGTQLRDEVVKDSPAAATASPAKAGGDGEALGGAGRRGETGDDGPRGRVRHDDADDRRQGRADDSSGPGSGHEDRSGRRGGDDDPDDSSGPGSGGVALSGSVLSGSGSSGSGSSGSGSELSGSGSSGSGSVSSASGSSGSGSLSSGSGSSGSGSSGSGTSGSGSSGSDSSGSGSSGSGSSFDDD
jgi:RNA polymerase sigma factor (sigma-70 family)